MGSVADFLEVEAGYERAVESVLGDLLQHVVVPTRAHAAAGLQFARDNDAGRPGFRFPARRIRADLTEGEDGPLQPFTLYGPTCDSVDVMKGPFLLPADIDESDWIELGQLGAYGACLRTRFNGFDRASTIEVGDPPMLPTPGYDQ